MDLDSALTGKPAEGADATDILRADHRQARKLFREYADAGGDHHASSVIAQSLCMQLELHDSIEREVLYPALREIDAASAGNALRAHDEIANAVRAVRGRADAGQTLDEAIGQLERLVEEHVQDEEQRLFPALEAQRTSSLKDLGRALIRRKEELTRSTESFESPAT